LIEARILTNEFYQDEEVTYYGWKCLECESVTENINRDSIEQFIRDHQRKTIHTKGKWHEYEDYDHSTKNSSKPVHIKVKDSISILESRKKNRDGFLFDGQIIRRLEHVFSNIYPLLGYEFKKIIDNMPDNKESYERFTRDLHNKLELRKNCEHDYKEPSRTLFGYGRQCSKCNHIQKVKEILVKRKKESN
jgi:hypothetical protein